MDGAGFIDGGLDEAERIAILYAPGGLRGRYRSLLLLDAMLRRTALSSRDPALTQVRLAWWREACAALPSAHGSPLISGLAAEWREETTFLTTLVDAWEEVAVNHNDLRPACESVAQARAAGFAECAGVALEERARAAARRWTFAAISLLAREEAQRAGLAAAALEIRRVPLPRALRPLAVLDGLAVRAIRHGNGTLLGDRLSPLAALRLGIFGR